MYKFLSKNGQMLAFGLGLVLTVVFFISVFGGIEEFNLMPEETQAETSIFNIGIWAAIVLAVLCVIASIAFGLFQMITNPKGALIGIIGIAGLAVVVLAFYFGMDADGGSAGVVAAMEENAITVNQSKMINAGLGTALVLGFGAIAAFVLSEIYNIFK
jgi:hypothetical protein